MNQKNDSMKALQEILSENLLADAYDLRFLAEWCKKSYPGLEICSEFRRQLLDAIHHPGLVSPKDYERWTDDESYPTQELLQDHFKMIWKQCFPGEVPGNS
jgi:hypothetical protein